MDNGVRSSDCANNRNETPRISQQDLQRHLAIVRNINAQYRNLLSDLNDHYEFLKSVQKCKNCNYTPRMDKVNHMQEQLIRVHSLNNEKVKMIKQLRELIENKINQLDAQNNNNNNNNNVKIKEVKDVALQTDLWTCSCDIMKKNNSNKKNDNDDANNDINDNKFNKNNDDNYDDSGPCCSRDIVNQIKVKPCASTNFTTNDSKVNAVKGDKNKSVATAKKFCSKTDTTTIDNNSKEYKNSYEYFKILPPNKRAKWYTEMYMKTELEAIKAKTTNEVGNDNVVKLKNINKKNNNKNSNAQKSANNANSSKIIENSNRATKTWATSKNTNNTNTSGNKAGTTKKATKTLYNKGGTSKKALTTLDCQPSTSKKTTGYRTNYGNGPSTSTGIRNWTDRGIENEATTNTSTGTGTGTGTRTGKNNNGRKRTNTDRGGGKRKKRKGRAAGRPPKKVAPIVPAVPITPIVSLLEPIDPYEPTYCVCNQISFGEMILCDNDLCPIEWFHFPCVSLITKPRGKWYCPICRGARSNIMRPKAEFIKELIRYNKEKEDAAQD